MKNKKLVIIMLVLLILVALAIVAYFTFFSPNDDSGNNSGNNSNSNVENLVQVADDGTKVNISEKLAETKVVDGLEISELTLTENNNITQLLGTITNKTEKEKEEHILKIAFLDKEGNEITRMDAYVKKLEPGESTQLNASTTFDYTNAYDIKIIK